MAPQILHVIERLSLGGASRALIATAAFSTRNESARHRILSLLPAEPAAIELANKAGLSLASNDRLLDEASHADILHIHFWNNPELYAALGADLPPARVCLTCHVGGWSSPQILTQEIIAFADLILATSPITLETADHAFHRKAVLAPSSADFDRLKGFAPSTHATFNVGYIGTIDFGKMHPAYASLHAAVDIAEARFIVCGAGAGTRALTRQIVELPESKRFDLRGYVNDIVPVLAELDVFGYPLCEDNYSTSELVLQEAMFAGIPSVVFSHGGAARLVSDGETGFVVSNEAQYIERVVRLYNRPHERAKMGRAAAYHARTRLGVENLGPLVDSAYERLMDLPKRARGVVPRLSGAEAFMRSLGSADEIFRESLSVNSVEAEAADAMIASASPALASATGGGILHYRRAYPEDPILRLWAGLALFGHGRPALAAAEFAAATKLAVSDNRAALYLSRAIRACGKL
jgi:glycosyltransferase involved in cell wall biosynthesis